MTIALIIIAAFLMTISLLFAYASGACVEEYTAIMEGDATRLSPPDRLSLLKKGAARAGMVSVAAAVAAFILLVLV